MENTYKTVESNVIIDGRSYNTYGIAYISDGQIKETIFDISLDKSKVESICEILNNNNIPLVHFRDITEDYTE